MSATVAGWGSLLALILVTGCASVRTKNAAEETETVEAEGWAAVDSKDLVGTRQRALAEAQRRAVEKVTGVFLMASTKVDAAVMVRQKIISDIKGYVRRYEVLGEKVEAGFLKTRIRAVVLRRKAGDEGMDSIPSKPPPESPPITVSILGVGTETEAWGAAADSSIRSKLLAHGFSMTGPGSKQSKTQSKLIIRGEVRAYPVKDPRLGAFLSYRAKVKIQVAELETGDVILERTQEASGLGLDSDSASSLAVENAGMLLGDTVARDVTAYLWKRF